MSVSKSEGLMKVFQWARTGSVPLGLSPCTVPLQPYNRTPSKPSWSHGCQSLPAQQGFYKMHTG